MTVGVDIQTVANLKARVGKHVSVIFAKNGKIKAENGILGHLKPEGINLLIDGLLHDTIEFFTNGKRATLYIYDEHDFEVLSGSLHPPMSFLLRDKDQSKKIIARLKSNFKKELFVVFKQKGNFYVRSGKLFDLGIQGLKLQTTYYEFVICNYNTIFNIFDTDLNDILKING